MQAKNVQEALQARSSLKKKQVLQSFFKTGPGQYGEDDVFLGVTVPEQRAIAKKFQALPLEEVEVLLRSSIHEHRLTGLLILLLHYQKVDKKKAYDSYMLNLYAVNNWDLVDLTAPGIVGDYLKDKERTILYDMVSSNNLWERRTAIVATYTFIKNRDYKDTLSLAKLLLNDPQDLMHKAVGWMLREVGKKDVNVLTEFLLANGKNMPRTTVRYAIERYPEQERKAWLTRTRTENNS